METPRSPPPADSGAKDDQEDTIMGNTSSTSPPTTNPFSHHPPDLLPSKIPQTFPDGNPSYSAKDASTDQQTAFDQRKNELMRKMTLSEMQSKYKEIALQITERLEENEKKEQEWEVEKDKMVQNHGMEAKTLKRMLSALQDD